MKSLEQVFFSNDVAETIDKIVGQLAPSEVFVLTDTNTLIAVLPRLSDSSAISTAKKITIKSGEKHKNIESLTSVWQQLTENRATRNSLLINIGGGVITDLGGFAASTFKRGIKFVNIPTTPLAAVDAAIGGKTGIDFLGFKNEIGVFSDPYAIIISSKFFSTLTQQEMYSGYAEMLKHSLLQSDKSLNRILSFDLQDFDEHKMLEIINESVLVKAKIVNEDPFEKGIRKALNFGHTVGHAFESFALKNKTYIPHGYAIAYGIIVELILSHFKFNFSSTILRQIVSFVRQHYGAMHITCNDYPTLLEYMHHDKKNSNSSGINFTLLRSPGQIEINNIINEEEIKQALDIYRDLLGL